MKFTKIQGTGNDFIIITLMEERVPEDMLPRIARRLCTRRLSIGADGFIALDRADADVSACSDNGANASPNAETCATGTPAGSFIEMCSDTRIGADYRMLFYNADGSLGEMCGNGARCVARYAYEHKLAGETQRMQTRSGVVQCERLSKRIYRVRLTDPTLINLSYDIELGGVVYPCSYVELGSPGLPHAIIRMRGLDFSNFGGEYALREPGSVNALCESGSVNAPCEPNNIDTLRELARAIRHHSAFPKGANVNFYDVIGENHIRLLTFERGVEDFTLSCGTGTGATALVMALTGVTGETDVRISNMGGDLSVTVDRAHNGDLSATADRSGIEEIRGLYLTGPTNIVASGIIEDEDLLSGL